MLDNSKLANPDFIDTIYSSDMSAACRFHCVNKWDENGIVLAARRDIVEAGLAPRRSQSLQRSLRQPPPLRKFRARRSCSTTFDSDTAALATESAAFEKLAKAAGVKFATASDGNCGKALKVLGYAEDAKKKLAEFVEALNASGAKKIVVSSPYVYDALVNDTTECGLKLSAKSNARLRICGDSENQVRKKRPARSTTSKATTSKTTTTTSNSPARSSRKSRRKARRNSPPTFRKRR